MLLGVDSTERLVEFKQQPLATCRALELAFRSSPEDLQQVTTLPLTKLLVDICLHRRLVACGEGLAALCPVPLCCNNPRCVELRGLSEQLLVAGRGSVCSRCRAARYCSKACQVAHHPAHKKICKSIAASTAKQWAAAPQQ
ncbi:hypothetical protein OEZ85_013207 [Tetradesmus obliquus]|uniref:phytol kinase n=1 Tax=Tetradesmus obliquus TaxID=3088 RepID=A0ABY8U5B1_TETOB|nr:hypothetical protein OEZ85_013207 [Tetradesmus obliquus]